MRDVLAISKALGDESRLRALNALRGGELCLCQLIRVLDLSPATVSKHMDVLHRSGLVARTRRGKWRFYRLADGAKNNATRRALDWALRELRGDRRLAEDARRARAVRRLDPAQVSACYRS